MERAFPTLKHPLVMSALVLLVLALVVGPIVPFLLVWALVFSAPLILAVQLARNRLNRTLTCGLIAGGFAVAICSVLWRVEWFDLWRHGVPTITYLLTFYLPYVAAAAAIGWLAGTIITPKSRRTRAAV